LVFEVEYIQADFPEELRDKLFTVLTKGQKEKVIASIVQYEP